MGDIIITVVFIYKLFFGTCYFDANLFSGLQVSSVAFDSYWSPPNSDEEVESVMYRFGSVGQVLISLYKTTNLLIWTQCIFFVNLEHNLRLLYGS